MGAERLTPQSVLMEAAGIASASARLSFYFLLAIFEPIVRLALIALAMLAFFLAFFFEYLTTLPNAPIWPLLGFSLGCLVTLAFYYLLMRLCR